MSPKLNSIKDIQRDEDRRTINFIAETDISNYLLRKGKTMINCMFNPLRRDGIESLHELCSEAEIELDGRRITRIGMVISNFPEKMIEISGAYNEDENDGKVRVLNKDDVWKELSSLSTKELQQILKVALGLMVLGVDSRNCLKTVKKIAKQITGLETLLTSDRLS